MTRKFALIHFPALGDSSRGTFRERELARQIFVNLSFVGMQKCMGTWMVNMTRGMMENV
jgi:hypothetical protein